MSDYSSLFAVGNDAVYRDAHLSGCLQYRWALKRWWCRGDEPFACFVMLNPSTADAAKDDPTIRRCMGFARSWGLGGLFVVNLFAWRATDPAELAKAADPVGRENNWAIHQYARVAKGPVVAAWGAHSFAATRAVEVVRMLNERGVTLNCLGTTKDGHPRHPLYVKGDAMPTPWMPAGIAGGAA